MGNFTQNQLDTLRSAFATGQLRVSYGDKTVVYRSLEEMKDLMGVMERDIASSSSYATKQVRQVRIRTSKGVF